MRSLASCGPGKHSAPGAEFLEESNGGLITRLKLLYNSIYCIKFTYGVRNARVSFMWTGQAFCAGRRIP